jgi:polyphosphate glucokinase
VGFPGVVKAGVTKTAANVDAEWIGFDLESALSQQLEKPVRVINDADMQGLGSIAGKGVELVLTFGTGLGGALFLDGKLVPNLEPGHHEFRKGNTYEQQLGNACTRRSWQEKMERSRGKSDRVSRASV